MADQLIKCSRCRCHRALSAFKLNKSGARNKTCLQCSIRKPIAPPIKLSSFADPPAPIVPISRADKAAAFKFIESQLDSMRCDRHQVWILWQEHQRAKIEHRNQKIRALLQTCPGRRRQIYFVPR